MNSKYISMFVTVAALMSFATFSPVYADTTCTGQYGQTVPCAPTNLNINKQVQDPVSGNYVQNITTTKFSQGDKVNFKLVVTNNSGETFHGVTVDDTMPSNVIVDDIDMTYTDRDGKKPMTITSDKKSVKFTINELAAGQSQTLYIMAHLVGPYSTEDTFCRDNWATVIGNERPAGDRTFARFCVANKVGTATTLPVAGVEDLIYVLPFALSGIGGLALLKKRS